MADFIPRLRAHVRAHRHVVRGDVWFLLQDRQTGRYHRLSPAAHHFLSQMDGRRSVGALWERCLTWSGDAREPPTQSEIIRLLAQLNNASLLAGALPPDAAELAERFDKTSRRKFLSRVKNPLAVRIPVFDPDRFLSLTMPLVRPLFSWFGLLAWLILIGFGLVTAMLHWPQITQNTVQSARLVENALLFLLVYPPLKLLHELGHGYAVKRWGESVHETGIMFLIFLPLPYVDASHSAAYDNKWKRIVVDAIGIMVELAAAAIAVLIFVSAEPGLVRDLALAVAVVGSVSTILFNANPLLRFDGYHILADVLEIPNLGQRSNAYWAYLTKKYVFGLYDAPSSVNARGERFWFLTYAVAAYIYKVGLMLTIAWFLASQFFFLGVALALWTLTQGLVWPIVRGIWWAATAPELRFKRARGNAVLAATCAFAMAGLFAVPLPLATNGVGIITLPAHAALRAETAGFLQSWNTELDREVETGTLIAALENPQLEARGNVLIAQRDELRLLAQQAIGGDQSQARMLQEQLSHAQRVLDRHHERVAGLEIRAAQTGRLVIAKPEALQHGFVAQGEQIGYVVSPEGAQIMVAIAAHTADFVRNRLRSVAVRPAEDVAIVHPARVLSAVPRASRHLPDAALGTQNGGLIDTDSRDPSGKTALQPVALVTVSVPGDLTNLMKVGSRYYVRFDHGVEPVGFRVIRSVRRAFLRQFRV